MKEILGSALVIQLKPKRNLEIEKRVDCKKFDALKRILLFPNEIFDNYSSFGNKRNLAL